VTAETPDLARCVADYAARLHRAAGQRHQVASALGAWLLLALAAPASSGADRDRLTEVLGCDAGRAARLAAELLDHPHPVVASAVALWTRAGRQLTDRFQAWRDALPDAVTRGDLPAQAALDAWAREHTFGLIDRFPLGTRDAWLVLASALATKVSWQTPFTLAPATTLGPASAWPRTLQRVLHTPDPRHSQGHHQYIAASPDAGDVAVHAAAAQDGLVVYSVAAAPDVPYLDVLAAAHRIAVADATGGSVARRDLKDLPLGDGPAWFIREERARSSADACIAVLPAWSARSEHDLTAPGLGFGAVASTLAPGDPWAAKQATMAKYSRTGFEAAAVTAVVALSAFAQPQTTRRVAELRFGHPYAVVAVATETGDAAESAAWTGLPVFSAWVSEPEDADDADDTAGRPL
jgi:Serpin (serine protease inhibitor)